MKRVKTADLIGAALDWAVAKCENELWKQYDDALEAEAKIMPARPSEYLRDYHYGPEFSPSTDWAQGGPIIEREELQVYVADAVDGKWCAKPRDSEYWDFDGAAYGPTPLIAAMRCFVASKLGAEVDVPEELL